MYKNDTSFDEIINTFKLLYLYIMESESHTINKSEINSIPTSLLIKETDYIREVDEYLSKNDKYVYNSCYESDECDDNYKLIITIEKIMLWR